MIATTVLEELQRPANGPPTPPETSMAGAKCAVCGDAAHGMHFNVSACRACAAFFRRSTISNRKYQCRFGGNCDVGKDVRCCCRACRMSKCLSLGMNSEAVQRHRDQIGPRRRQGNTPEPEAGEGAPELSRASSHSSTEFPSPLHEAPFSAPATNLFHGVGVSVGENAGAGAGASSLPPTFLDANGRSYAMLNNASPSPCFAAGFGSPSTSTAFLPTNLTSPNSAFSKVTSCGTPTSQVPDPLGHLQASAHLYTQLGVPLTSPMPFLSEVFRGYKKLCSLRKTTNRLKEDAGLLKLFDDNIEITLGTYNDNVATIKNDLSLVSEMISDHFLPLNKFSVESKWLLLRNFFCPFILAERAVNSAKLFPDKNDCRMLISSQHYINYEQMAHFFDVDACKGAPVDVAKIFEKTFAKARKLICNLFIDLNLSDDEVAGLFAILFWSEDFDGLTSEEERLVAQTRDAVFEELYYACRCRVSSTAELGSRFGRICNVIPIVKRTSSELSDDFSVVNLLDIFNIDTFLHRLIPNMF